MQDKGQAVRAQRAETYVADEIQYCAKDFQQRQAREIFTYNNHHLAGRNVNQICCMRNSPVYKQLQITFRAY